MVAIYLHPWIIERIDTVPCTFHQGVHDVAELIHIIQCLAHVKVSNAAKVVPIVIGF